MRTYIRIGMLGLCIFGSIANAQTVEGSSKSFPIPPPSTFDATSEKRAEMASAIVHRKQKAVDALEQLQKLLPSAKQAGDFTGEFSYAALDMGHRLIAADMPADAEIFFQAAEKSLAELVKTTSDSDAQAKAEYLQALSLIRANYLNKPSEAKLDIEQAITLQPNDKHLQSKRDLLVRENPEPNKEHQTDKAR